MEFLVANMAILWFVFKWLNYINPMFTLVVENYKRGYGWCNGYDFVMGDVRSNLDGYILNILVNLDIVN